MIWLAKALILLLILISYQRKHVLGLCVDFTHFRKQECENIYQIKQPDMGDL